MTLIEKLNERRASLLAQQDGISRQIVQLEAQHKGLGVAIAEMDFAIAAAEESTAPERAPEERSRRNIRSELLALVQDAGFDGIAVSAAKARLLLRGPVRDRAIQVAVERLSQKGRIIARQHDALLGDMLIDAAKVDTRRAAE